MRFTIQPSIYCPDNEWYLLCSVKEASDIDNVIKRMEQVLKYLKKEVEATK